MRVFSVAYFNRGGSRRNSKGTSSSSNNFGTSAAAAAVPVVAAAPGNGAGRASRDDRPFPPVSSEVASGAYIISSPPRYYDSSGGAGAQASHTLQFVRSAMQRNLGSGGGGGGGRREGWRGSNPDLKGMNNSGFTIYADCEEGGGGGGSDWPPSSLSTGRPRRRRHGSSGAMFSGGGEGEKGIRSMKSPFQRSRSASGRRRRDGACHSSGGGGFVWPNQFYPAIAAAASSTTMMTKTTTSEPIYSEPLPPMTLQVREAEKKSVQKQCYPNPHEPAEQISQHIYEYLVTRRQSDAACKHVAAADCRTMNSKMAAAAATLPKAAPRPRHSLNSTSDSRSVSVVSGPATRRRGSLSSSSSPSSSTASSASKRDSQDSVSGRQADGH